MTSSYLSESHESGSIINCTTASTFEKPKSLKFEILFGDYHSKVPQRHNDKNIVNAFEYLFSPGEIFGFAYESSGVDFKKFHHVFILRACLSGESGNVIPGILPGAEIIAKTLTDVGSNRLKSVLQKLEKNKIILSKLSIVNYQRLNDLLETKISADFLVGELIGKATDI